MAAFITPVKSPSVTRFIGKNRILANGFTRKLRTVKTPAAAPRMAKLFPVEKPGIIMSAKYSARALYVNARSSDFICFPSKLYKKTRGNANCGTRDTTIRKNLRLCFFAEY